MDSLLVNLSIKMSSTSDPKQTHLDEHDGHVEDHVEHPKTCCGRCAGSVIAKVLEADRVLHAESDLSPRNPVINRTLGGFVRALTDAQSGAQAQEEAQEAAPPRPAEQNYFTAKDVEKVLLDSSVAAVRAGLLAKLSEAEAEMEVYYTNKFLEAPELNLSALRTFIYWDNYECLVGTEVKVLRKLLAIDIGDASNSANTIDRSNDSDTDRSKAAAAGNWNWHTSESIAVVGSGPLPLTAIILHQKLHVAVTCIDRDPTACRLAEALINRLNLQSEIRIATLSGSLCLLLISLAH